MNHKHRRLSERCELLTAVSASGLLIACHLILLLNRGPLWRDEISSLSLATQPTMGRFWNALALDPFPGLFFLLLRCWHALVGDSDLALRGFGCLVGIACIGAFWGCARLTGRKTPLLLLVLAGLSPNFIVWGDSLRAYGLGTIWAVLFFGFVWRLSQRLTPWRVGFSLLFAILSVQTLYTNSLLVLACSVAAMAAAARRRQWKNVIAVLSVGFVAACSLLPYLSLFRQMKSWASLGQVDFPLSASFYMLYAALLGSAQPFLWIWIAIVVGALISVVCFRGSDAILYGVLAALLAFVTTFGFYRAVGWGTNVWYYLPMLTIMAAGVDQILDLRKLWPWSPLARSGAGLIATALLLPLCFRFAEIRASNLDLIAQAVAERAAPEDLVIVWPSCDAITFNRYLPKPMRWVSIPQAPNLPPQPGDDLLAPFRDGNSLQPTLAAVKQTLHDGHRVWIASTWNLEPFPGGPPPVIKPLTPEFRGTMGYYLRGWGYHLVQELQHDAREMSVFDLPSEQPINPYERSHVVVFSGERDAFTSL